MENIEKIYGEYPGNLGESRLKEIDRYSEMELFLAISTLENFMLDYKRVIAFNMNRGMNIEEDEYALEYLIGKTVNFGVELEKDEQGKVRRTGDYACWYEFHLRAFGKVLDMNQYKKFQELKRTGYNVSRYLPNDSYLEYKRKKEAEQRNVETTFQKIMGKSNSAS